MDVVFGNPFVWLKMIFGSLLGSIWTQAMRSDFRRIGGWGRLLLKSHLGVLLASKFEVEFLLTTGE